MEARHGSTGTSPDPQRVVHVAALLAIVVVALALSIFMGVGTVALPNDALDEAEVIEGLPFRDDAVRLSDASAGPDEPAPSCFSPNHTAWYVLQPDADVPLTTWLVPDGDGDDPLDVALSVWSSIGDEPPVEVGCVDERGPGAAEQLVLPAMSGSTYHFGVGSPLDLDDGADTLTFLLDEQAPAHDLFAFAHWVDGTPYEDADVDASGARREPGETRPSCADMEATTWYGISPPHDAVLSARVEPSVVSGEPIDVALALHTGGSVDALLERACVDSVRAGGMEHLEFPVSEGELYWLEVGAVLGDTGPGAYTLAIDAMQSIVLAPIPDTVFGASPLEITAEASSGLPVAIEVEGPCEVSDGQLSVLGAGLCTITATQAGDDGWAPAQPVTTTLNVGRGSQAITIAPISGARVGVPVAVQAATESGLPVTIRASGPCRVEDGSVVPSGAGTCVLTAGQPGDDDWAPAEPVTRTVRIARGEQALDFAPLPELSVGDTVELEASSDSGLPVVFETEGACRVTGGALAGTNAGPCTVTAGQPGDTDWAPAEPVTQTVDIARGEQAIELGATPDTVFGASPLDITAEADSGLPVSLVVEGPCRIGDGALESTGAGTCVLTAGQPGDDDWAPAEPLVRRITIAPASQTIALDPLPELSVGDAAELEASSDSDLPVELEATGPCLVMGDRLQALGAGTCVLTAGQPGDDDWAPAEPVTRTVRIARGEQALDFAPIERVSLADGSVELVASSSAGLPLVFVVSGPCHVDGDVVVFDGSGLCTISASQPGTVDWVPAEATQTFRIVSPEEEWREAEDELLERTESLGCSTVGTEGDPRPLSNGAIAGVRCDGAIDGVSTLWLFTYPDTESLRAFQETRVNDGRGDLPEDSEACVSGQPGTRAWEHGLVACWIPEGASRPVLHWTDERTDTYGVIRPRTSSEGRLDELWSTVLDEVFEGSDEESEAAWADTSSAGGQRSA